MNPGGVVILGARSWIGFRLAQAFAESAVTVLGTTSAMGVSSPVAASGMPFIQGAAHSGAICSILHSVRPRLVFNLLRGEHESGLDTHIQVARLCAELGSRYIFASSALVFEGHAPGMSLDESALPAATTHYSSFKIACEQHLARQHPNGDWQVLRFASIQGWSPWKLSRNEVFLGRLAKGDSIRVDTGVVQNRMLDLDFARQVRDTALLPVARGVMHMGADDASEEVEFLRRVATAFDWPAEQVQPGLHRDCRIALECARTHALTGGRWRRTEAQTVAGLLREPGLSGYRALR